MLDAYILDLLRFFLGQLSEKVVSLKSRHSFLDFFLICFSLEFKKALNFLEPLLNRNLEPLFNRNLPVFLVLF